VVPFILVKRTKNNKKLSNKKTFLLNSETMGSGQFLYPYPKKTAHQHTVRRLIIAANRYLSITEPCKAMGWFCPNEFGSTIAFYQADDRGFL